ncbi:MAG: TetR/AcrR family transcriptional regulator [Alphaproteobacteria bacterium]|nr:TetR/AcrR family transcriptional regulator [Alphaproteobacteria bacterium]MBL7096218.1 TetR/AcrR family transcriptional regulator [Alphaproteobacteria bacterium]
MKADVENKTLESSEDGTRTRVLDVVEPLLMERGFNAVSYQDISDRIGIRKASVHYHFPTKADLGAAVIRRYADRVDAMHVPVEMLSGGMFAVAFERFLGVFAQIGARSPRVCLGGVLGGEFETLPEAMQVEVRRFFTNLREWLGAVLERGRAQGVFTFAGDGETAARAMVAMLEGALVIGRALRDPDELAAALGTARRMVLPSTREQ